ncbi:MAG: hypothetical protein DWQ08_15135, partial [Proteobacteria bacterium]
MAAGRGGIGPTSVAIFERPAERSRGDRDLELFFCIADAETTRFIQEREMAVNKANRVLAATLLMTASISTELTIASNGDLSMSRISGDVDSPRRHFRLRHPADAEPAELERLYQGIRGALAKLYSHGDASELTGYQDWTRFNRTPYLSKVHGNHYLNNYGNDLASSYADYPAILNFPPGAVLAKDSFAITESGAVLLGPLAVMVKMASGFNAVSGDWKFLQIQPNGEILGETNGPGSDRV